jgi:hypothetical protein
MVELGAQIKKPTDGLTTSNDVEEFCKKMKELMENFNEFNAHFKYFMVDLMKTVSSITFVTP